MTTAAGSAPWDLFGYFADHRAEVLELLWSHAWLSLLPVVLGIVLCVLLALVFDGLIVLGTRLLTPWQRAGVAR